jgi:glutaconate CoA-transferase subunit A
VDGWGQFVATYLSGSEADYQAAVRRFTVEQEAKS